MSKPRQPYGPICCTLEHEAISSILCESNLNKEAHEEFRSCTHRNKADCRHLVGCKGARFVGADDCCAPQRLHRRQFANDYVPLRHAPRT